MPKARKEDRQTDQTKCFVANSENLFQEVGDIIKLMSAYSLAELDLETPNFKITLRRKQTQTNKIDTNANITKQIETIPSRISMEQPNISGDNKTLATTDKEIPSKKEAQLDVGKHRILAPIAGTFYRAPSPSAAPFVKVGDEIKVGQPVCIIEAMKLMNEIKADKAGKILQILVENGKPVEKGTMLFLIETGDN